MTSKQLQRKPAAILYADVAGYSRFTGEDEEVHKKRLTPEQLMHTRHAGRLSTLRRNHY